MRSNASVADASASTLPAKVGAVFYVLWGLTHVAGDGLQLATLGSGGGGALGEMISTARPLP